MNDLLFLDTETTGNDVINDRLFQVCYSDGNSLVAEYFKPPLPISIKSQSITHVTNKMVANKQSFSDSPMKQILSELLKTKILVAHNAAFDIQMLLKEGVEVPRYICTLKLARFLDEEAQIPEYNLQFLRYFFELDINASAHEAKDDVLVLQALFQKQYKAMLEKYKTHEKVIQKMIEVSTQPSLLKLFTFGKHRGKKIEEVASYDRSYMEWMLAQKMQNSTMEEDWIFTLKYHLKK